MKTAPPEIRRLWRAIFALTDASYDITNTNDIAQKGKADEAASLFDDLVERFTTVTGWKPTWIWDPQFKEPMDKRYENIVFFDPRTRIGNGRWIFTKVKE